MRGALVSLVSVFLSCTPCSMPSIKDLRSINLTLTFSEADLNKQYSIRRIILSRTGLLLSTVVVCLSFFSPFPISPNIPSLSIFLDANLGALLSAVYVKLNKIIQITYLLPQCVSIFCLLLRCHPINLSYPLF